MEIMKNLKIILYTLFLGITITSCGDSFLDVSPTTQIPMEEYYDTEEEITKGLISAYGPLQWPDFVFGQYAPTSFLGDIISDDVRVGGSSANDIPYFTMMRFFNATSEYVPINLWITCYSGVYRSNLVINNMDNVKDISTSNKNRILAEAHTLRAYYYYLLWKFWGNIPYYNVNPVPPDCLVPQMKADEVYIKIVEDLDYAISDNKLPFVTSTAQKGRFTKAAAQMLKANVVMYEKDATRYAEVLNDMREIINSGIFSLYSSFANLWEDEGEWCTESIWEINYTDNPSSRTWENTMGVGGTVFPILIGINAVNNSDFAGGYGFSPVEPSLYNAYDSRDTRRDGGILNFAKYKISHPSASYTPRYDDTGLFNLKYIARKNGNDKYTGKAVEINYRNNLRIFRYSETLLKASELIVRIGESQDEADTYLNQVRARAFGYSNINDLGFQQYKKISTLDNLLEENRLEFACEGHRFWDLVRFDKAQEVLGSRGYNANKKYLPIPQSEIDQSYGTLKQNPY